MRALVTLAILSPAFLLAQDQSLASLVLSETPFLDASPDLAAWRNRHPNERLKTATYDNEYQSQGLWCAASVSDVALPGGIKATRMAFFYVPSEKSGDALPAREDTTLTQRCRLLALWYEVNTPTDPVVLAKSVSDELAASLGSAEEPPRFKRTDGDWGSGLWNPYLVWEGPNRRIALGVDPGGPIPDSYGPTRLLVIARASQAPRGFSDIWSGEPPKDQPSLKDAAVRLAALAPTLSAPMLAPRVSPESLIRWLEAAQGLPARRKAAALALADLTVNSALLGVPDNFLTTPAGRRLSALDAGVSMGHDGLEYQHIWRSRAENMDPVGPGGEIARVARLEDPCTAGSPGQGWQSGVVDFGDKLLRDFPASLWKSYIHLAMARGYANNLMWTYPGIENPDPGPKPTDPEGLRRGAISHFRAFLEENPASPEAEFAWRETWRLLAGLPPTPVLFACTD